MYTKSKKELKREALNTSHTQLLHKWFKIFEYDIVHKIIDKQREEHYHHAYHEYYKGVKYTSPPKKVKYENEYTEYWKKSYAELLEKKYYIRNPYYYDTLTNFNVIIKDIPKNIKHILSTPRLVCQKIHKIKLISSVRKRLALAKLLHFSHISDYVEYDCFSLIIERIGSHISNYIFNICLHNYFCDHPNPYKPKIYTRQQISFFNKKVVKSQKITLSDSIFSQLSSSLIHDIVMIHDILTYISGPYFQKPTNNGIISSSKILEKILQSGEDKDCYI
tara:strand:- start:2 stop:832 length:831 start_codon:yes stop_codon:yes gene_type:complete